MMTWRQLKQRMARSKIKTKIIKLYNIELYKKYAEECIFAVYKYS